MYFATPTGQINRGTMFCPTLKLKAIWTNSEQTNFLGFCPRICSAYLKQQYCEINSRMYTYASPAYKVYLVFNLEIAPEPFKTILIESNKFLNVMLCPENGPVLVQGTVLQCTPLVSPALHWCRAVVVWATVSVVQAELGMQPELVMPVVLVIMPCWLSREAARPAGPGGAALMVLLAVVLLVEGNMELHVTISELSWPPKPPGLWGLWAAFLHPAQPQQAPKVEPELWRKASSKAPRKLAFGEWL